MRRLKAKLIISPLKYTGLVHERFRGVTALALAVIGLGSNLGNKLKNIAAAAANLKKLPKTVINRMSSCYKTAPWGKTDQDWFVNQVIAVETNLEPMQLLKALQNIEIKMGRQRTETWGPRIIDLDILWYGGDIVRLPGLTIPHPHMRERLFVLIPLMEIEPDLIFPEDGLTIKEVLGRVLEREGADDIIKL